jgi:hypothetical protein
VSTYVSVFKSHPYSYKECTWTFIRFVDTVLKIIFLFYNDLSRKGCYKGKLEDIKIRIMSQRSEAV